MKKFSKRTLLKTAVLVPFFVVGGPAYPKENLEISVTKGRGCGCCTVWTKILRERGFTVTEKTVLPAELVQLKSKLGVPTDLMACHTAEISGYIVEGHVPDQDIRRLLVEKPDALGIAVPGMPYGSPGMGPEEERESYEVYLFHRDGSKTLFSSYDAKG